MKEEVTRTLVISNFHRSMPAKEVASICKSAGEVKEHFILQNKDSVLFVAFFDLRASEQAFEALSKKKVSVKYTISTCEAPRGSDICTEETNQGTLVYTSASSLVPNEASIYARSSKNADTFLRFYDSRDALAHLSALKKSHPKANPHLAWDNDLRKRRNMLLEAEEIVRNAPFQVVPRQEEAKRSMAPETRKKAKVSTNWMLALFDKYIIEHATEISKSIH
ncbi:hypothetical protein NEDG_01946 [Nematocida displodere]|uniref:RRM domain-containing protein n=1 Tax=Nematocida displodere TaxID=1805483 RepID=A0A177EKA9_9MICR|nr:hypothetical protein NEDG_01946 [Nematocida displodere]